MLDPVPLAGAGRQGHTVTVSPVSAAKRASSVFHSRVRPVGAAAIGGDQQPGRARAGLMAGLSHHVRIVWTANWAVSWSVPTATQPEFAPMS